jgi:FXSXX-COOH protein
VSQSAASSALESDLVDLSRVSLAALPGLDERILAPAMRRVLKRAGDPESITRGYNPQRLD